MKLEKIISISGKPGLYKLISQLKNGFIVEDVLTKKKASISNSSQVSLLDNIAMFTFDKEVPLFEKSNPIINNYLFGLQRAESTYMILLQQGWKAEQARQILPLSVKSELVLCGFDDCWDNFLYRRNDVHAHPMAHELAEKVKELLNK